MYLKIKASVSVVCFIYLLTLLTNASEEANCVDPDQTAHVGVIRSGSTLFNQESS